jgi:hypothetical protein
MDVRINEVQSQIHAADPQSMLDPHVLKRIIRECVEAVKEELEREKRVAAENRLNQGVSSDER